MSKIVRIHAREILDSRGSPTIEVDVFLPNAMGRFAVPSGASTGKHEALELRDGDIKHYGGKGVSKAVAHVNNVIADALVDADASNQLAIDETLIKLDGTVNKSVLSANAILGVSMAVAKAVAEELGQPFYRHLGGKSATTLPVPLMNVINGGAHADNRLDIQEFMIVPFGTDSFRESLRCGVEIFHCLKAILRQKGLLTSVGDEGGFAPELSSNEQALDLLLDSIQRTGFDPLTEVGIALDAAASEFYDEAEQKYRLEDRGSLSPTAFCTWWKQLAQNYPILSIEDALDQNDWGGWKTLTAELGDRLQLVGDDLFVTNPSMIAQGIEEQAANAVLIKPNQIGTLLQTLEAIEVSHRAGYNTILSHRSGETEDTTIADLAVATKSTQIKAGSLSRSERVAKYNRLLRIEEELGNEASYFGKSAFKKWLKK